MEKFLIESGVSPKLSKIEKLSIKILKLALRFQEWAIIILSETKQKTSYDSGKILEGQRLIDRVIGTNL